MVSPGVGFAILFNVILLSIGAAILGYGLLHRRTRSDNERDPGIAWYERTISLAEDVQELAEGIDPGSDHRQVQRRVIPLSEQLKGHARSAPDEVDEQVVRILHDLGVNCYKVGMEHTRFDAARTGEFIEDKVETLAASARDLEDSARDRLEKLPECIEEDRQEMPDVN
ncbi:MAG: hypothetical protein ABEI52_02500 [Halobacteriaceae archaeon]